MGKHHFLPLLLLGCCTAAAQTVYTGDETTAEDFSRILRSAERATRDFQNLPPSASLKAYAPPVKDQGTYGTCVAWSAAYAARTISYARHRGLAPDSMTAYRFSPGHLYQRIRKPTDASCLLGASILTAMQQLKEGGNALYTEGTPECSPVLAGAEEAARYRIQDFLALTAYGQMAKNDVLRAKKSLADGKPLLLSVKCYPSLKNGTDRAGIWTPVPGERQAGNHAMCIVGYNDAVGGGAFEVMNSWGPGWGAGGFFWLTYDQLLTYGNYLVEMMDGAPAASPAGPAPAAVPAPAPLGGTLRFVRTDGRPMPVQRKGVMRGFGVEDDSPVHPTYRMTETYAGGTTFKVEVTTAAPAYVYIFGKDDKGTLSRLFPYATTVSPVLNGSGATIILPSETKHVRLDNTPGTETLCVLFSREALPLEDLMAAAAGPSLQGAVSGKLSGRLLSGAQFDEGALSFRGPSGGQGSAVLFFIELAHN